MLNTRNFREHKIMKTAVALHQLIQISAKMAGKCPTIWSSYQLGNDRGSEFSWGPGRIV